MGITDKVFGPSYDIKTIRRQVRGGNQHKVVEDRAAVVTDEVTDEKKLKFKSDGKEVPKPSNLSFDSFESTGFLNRGTSDLIELEEDGDKVSIIDFTSEEGSLNPERSEKEHLFQAHRNFVNKKTMEAWSQEDNKEFFILGTIALIVVINLAGQYFIIGGLEQGVAEGVVRAFENINADDVIGS